MEQNTLRGTKHRLRSAVVALGKRLPTWMVSKLGNLVRDVELRQWMARQGLSTERTVNRREELFEMVGREIGDLPVLYVEFGVARGEATRFWSKLLKHPSSALHGFDSFEGLPEKWVDGWPKGAYRAGGKFPDIDDPRIHFFKGLFHETLPAYKPPKHQVAIVNMDADLYSSTILALRTLRDLFTNGTYLYFDEFSIYGHEERAFREFVEETGLRFILRGTTPGLRAIMFQCVGRNPA